MKRNKNLIITNTAIIALLVAELFLLASGHGVWASILAGIAAIAAIVFFVLNRGGEAAIAAICCLGYALAIISGVVIGLVMPGYAVGVGLFSGGITFVAQMVLSVTRNEGRM